MAIRNETIRRKIESNSSVNRVTRNASSGAGVRMNENDHINVECHTKGIENDNLSVVVVVNPLYQPFN